MTANKAAAETRSKILRKMGELEQLTTKDSSRYAYEALWEELRIYIKNMATRASEKAGGF